MAACDDDEDDIWLGDLVDHSYNVDSDSDDEHEPDDPSHDEPFHTSCFLSSLLFIFGFHILKSCLIFCVGRVLKKSSVPPTTILISTTAGRNSFIYLFFAG